MITDNTAKEVCFRYHLKNSSPIDLVDFTKSLQAIQDEYVHYSERKGATRIRARLNLHKVEHGSIICDIIEAIPSAVSHLGAVNTLFEFGGYLKSTVEALLKGTQLPTDARNMRSMDNLSSLVTPLARTPNSELTIQTIDLGSGNSFEHCTFNITTTDGNALQNLAQNTKIELEDEVLKTEEQKSKVLLRLMQINKEQASLQDKGVIEAFDKNKKKLLYENDDIKREFTEGDENFFKYLYEVDATALYNDGRLVAYRITKVHTKFDPNED